MTGPELNFLTPAWADLERMAEFLRALGWAEDAEEPFDSPYGFRGFSLRDPEGNIWDVAWKRGSTVTPDGDLTWS